MILIDRPCCATPLPVELPMPDTLRCDACAVEWTIEDPTPLELSLAA